MNKLLLLFLLSAISGTAFGQNIRFSDATNTWSVRASGKDSWSFPYEATYQYSYGPDTFVKGATYRKLAAKFFKQNGNPPAPDIFLVREDTAAGKVWCRLGSAGTQSHDTDEKLIYDAAWQIGDSIINKPGASRPYFVKRIDSAKIDGVWHKVFGVSTSLSPQAPIYTHIIEGIGAAAGPGFAFTGALTLESNYTLLCFFNRASKPVVTPFPNGPAFSNAGPCNLAVGDAIMRQASWLSPNPATPASRIMIAKPIASGSLCIFDATGRLITSGSFSQSTAIPLPQAAGTPGLYYYRITDRQSGGIVTGRYIIQ